MICGKFFFNAIFFYTFIFYLNISYSKSNVDQARFENYQFPKREFSVVVTNNGYFPDKLVFFSSEEITLWVTGTQEIASCLNLEVPTSVTPILLSAKKGALSSATFKIDRAGVYTYSCPGLAFKGTAIVLGKDDKKNETKAIKMNASARSVSSIEDWKPRVR